MKKWEFSQTIFYSDYYYYYSSCWLLPSKDAFVVIAPSTQNRNYISPFIFLKTKLTDSQLYRLATPKAASYYMDTSKNYRLTSWLYYWSCWSDTINRNQSKSEPLPLPTGPTWWSLLSLQSWGWPTPRGNNCVSLQKQKCIAQSSLAINGSNTKPADWGFLLSNTGSKSMSILDNNLAYPQSEFCLWTSL